MKKKIALVNVFFEPQNIGGATRVFKDNIDILLDQYSEQFELVVFCSDDTFKEPYQLDCYLYRGIRVYRTSILFRENMDWHPKDDKIYSLFNDFLQIENPDIVHFHCIQRLTASVVEATRSAKIPYFVTVHDAWWISDFQFLVDPSGKVYPDGHVDPFESKPTPNNVTIEESISRSIYLKDLLNDADKTLIVSESFAQIYQKNEIRNVVVNKNGISSSVKWLPKNTSYTDKVVCAHIGGMSEHKGYHLFKSAFQDVQPNNLEVLVVDHSKPDGYVLKDHWGSVNVQYIGRVNQNNIVKLYQSIDVLFAPSIWPESYGLVTREAAACGCWVVTGDIGGIGEDIIEKVTGFTVNTKATSELINVLSTISKNHNKYKLHTEIDNIRLVEEQVSELSLIYRSKIA